MITHPEPFEETDEHYLPERCATFGGETTRVVYRIAQIAPAPEGMLARFRFLDKSTGEPTNYCGSTAVPALGTWKEWDQAGTRRVSRRRRGAGPLLVSSTGTGALVPLPEFVATWTHGEPIRLMGCEIELMAQGGFARPVGPLMMDQRPILRVGSLDTCPGAEQLEIEAERLARLVDGSRTR
jgi:hypothetical protein